MRDEPIEDVPVENLGPAMLALNAMQRRFVVACIRGGGKVSTARAARAAGYAPTGSRVRAFEQMHNPKVIAALKEEADRRLDWTAVKSILQLERLVEDKNPKVRMKAIDSVLDRRGYARASSQMVQIEDKRAPRLNYEQLLSAVAQKLQQHNLAALPAPIDVEFEEVTVGGPSPD